MDGLHCSRRRLLQGAFALPATTLAGCVVMPYGPYYRPSTGHPGATYKGAWCNGAAGPTSVVEVALADGVTLTARAERAYPERDRTELPLRLTLTLPPTQPARFDGPSLKVNEVGSGKAIGREPEVVVYRYAALPADRWIDPARVRPSGTGGTSLRADEPHGRAGVRVTLEPGFAPDQLALEGPVITHARGSTRMPAVAMSRPASKTGVREYRSAELNARLQDKAAACRRDTPRLACDNIVEHSDVSFDVDGPDARWSGRWTIAGEGPKARIEGDIGIASRVAGPWRLASNSVAVRDPAGVRQVASFAHINLALNDRIALDTPLFAGPVDGTGNARMSIEVLLPGAPADFEVLLPRLVLGARTIEVAPIRFDRRTFDGGVEPFNC